jgi:DNA-binding XRE family transcriptional regulator
MPTPSKNIQRIDVELADLRFLLPMRHALGWSQLVIADLVGLSAQTILVYEKQRAAHRLNIFTSACIRRMFAFTQSAEGRDHLHHMARTAIMLKPTDRAATVMAWLFRRDPPKADGSYTGKRLGRHLGQTDISLIAWEREKHLKTMRNGRAVKGQVKSRSETTE